MAVVKGIVVESHEKEAVILTRSGQFRKIRLGYQAEIGDEVEQKEWRQDLLIYTVAVALLFLLTVQMVSLLTVCANISVQVNPGVELGVNSLQRVVTVKALNQEGSTLLKTVHVKGKKVDAALAEIITESIKAGYMSTGGRVTVGVSSINKKGEKMLPVLTPRLEVQAFRALRDNNHLQGVEVKVIKT